MHDAGTGAIRKVPRGRTLGRSVCTRHCREPSFPRLDPGVYTSGAIAKRSNAEALIGRESFCAWMLRCLRLGIGEGVCEARELSSLGSSVY